MNIDQWNAAVDAKRAELFRLRHGSIEEREPKPGSLRPFKHAAALYTAIVECRAKYQNNLFELQQALAAFPPYVSRGHGGKHRTKNRTILGSWNQDRSKYQPHVGKKELAKAAYRALSPAQRVVADRITGDWRTWEPELPA